MSLAIRSELPLGARLAHLTHALCAIPSVTGDEGQLCDDIDAWWRARGLGPIERIGNTLCAGKLDDPRPTLALFGHLDTVPPEPGGAACRIETDRVVGLGSSDMKSGLAVMMALAEELDLPRLPYNLLFIFYEREEGPYAENGLGPLLSQHPELNRVALAFALESTDVQLHVGCMGSLQATATFTGRRAHSARPWEGKNAIHRAAPLLAALAARGATPVLRDGFEFFEVLSATLASGGTARNVVPDHFQLNLNYRFAPGKSLEEAEVELRAFVGGAAELTVDDRSPAGRLCAGNPHLGKFRALTGVEAAPKQAWTDVGRLTAHGIDAVNFGPGSTKQAHQAGEYVLIENLERCYGALRRFLETR